MKKTMLLRRKFMRHGAALALALSLVFGAATGCTPSANQNTEQVPGIEQPQIDEKSIMDGFKQSAAEAKEPKTVIQFINENIKQVSKENAVFMINELEKLQKEYISQLETKFFDTEVQKEFIDSYTNKGDINDPESFENSVLKDLINETLQNGFKVDTAEGMFYPVLDYSSYKDYIQYLNDDMRAYLEIMSIESQKAPAKDAALVIGWKEVVERALRQEKFISSYQDSTKLDDVKKLYNNYRYFVFFGLNNTPLFSYEDGIMNSDAKAMYTSMDLASKDSELSKSLAGYMELLKNNNYKLTKEIEEYRNAVVGK